MAALDFGGIMKLIVKQFIVPITTALLLNFSNVHAASFLSKSLLPSTLLALVLNNIQPISANFCPLCENYAQLPKNLDFPLDCNQAYTCLNLYVDLASIDENDSKCLESKTLHQATCCDEEEPAQQCPPSSAPQYDGPIGDEPECPICGTLEYPGIPNELIIARYVGEYTCDQLYHRGLNGLTPAFICGALQDFAESVCGCGEFNPKCIENETECWGYIPVPSPSPTPAPNIGSTMTPTQDINTQAPFPKRKTPRKGPKYGNKLSAGRGGAGGRNKGGRMMKGIKTSYLRKDTPEESIEIR